MAVVMLETESYYIVSDVFARADMRQLAEDLSRADVDRTKAGARHILGVPAVHAVAKDPRMLAIAQSFVGLPAVPFRATLFDKSPDANWLVVWHQDTALPLRQRNDASEWGPWSTKAGVLYAHAPAWALEQVVALRVSLDDSLKTNGPLRVLPGTHREGVLTEEQIEGLARHVTPIDCVASSGSVVAMRPLIVHASSKARSDHRRRVLHIEYAASMDLGAGIELAVG
jgi:ectoine hydroxylase-related dioxygenase (phytanoyl-CoA dioxygenase family)